VNAHSAGPAASSPDVPPRAGPAGAAVAPGPAGAGSAAGPAAVASLAGPPLAELRAGIERGGAPRYHEAAAAIFHTQVRASRSVPQVCARGRRHL
jgi:hypothetical protein